ncbi:uncharacterized protein FTJAE_7708 [Fusarium tjaetaba]|uniref:Uncharacterized protein n=1 Tax=Fusarium tjaetaba TaxID=1567544 RepID=A0A8H5RFC5_9HYPO|nr:uncharacterized protein FTJAE_7708 [Fusarium tjaetaba]KAF5631978.1 hypothetical protein FTJAE_7708 [Fusarium tjaetaba]
MDTALPLQQDGENGHSQDDIKPTGPAPEESNMNNIQRHPHTNRRTPEPQDDRQANNSDPPDTPGVLEPFDWDEFEARYEAALQEADEREREILKEADALSKYFKIWAASASGHDDERAAKRLQTRRRFVNLAENKMERKQQHYDQVVRAFESALALLKSHISTDDLVAFHESHFSHTAIAAFGSEFVDSPPQDQIQDDAVNNTWEEEDDGLGYYPDGVKRTLTDAQIEIFRHSELETQRKEKERAKQLGLKETAPSSDVMDLSDDTPTSKQTKNMSSLLPTSFQSNKKRKKKNGLQRPRPEPKPDLRKRTWDVVDKGLDSLEYD